MMKVGGVKPIGIAAVLFHGIESTLKVLLTISLIVVFFLLVMLALAEFDYRAKQAREKEKELKQEKIREANHRANQRRYEKYERERKREKEEADRLWKEELARNEIEKIEYLKTRSADDANRDALKDFL
jgi:hypothetical protein